MARTVDFRHLHIAPEPLGSGGQASVYALATDDALAFKWFAEPTSTAWDEVERVIDVPESINAQDRALIDRLAAWPTAIVLRDRKPVGTLIRRMPSSCQVEVRTPRGVDRVDASIAQLMFRDSPARSVVGIDHCRTTDWSLRILLRAAEFLALLHNTGHRFGDISSANWLFDTETANPFFLDCDGIRTSAQRAAVQTPDWMAPIELGGVAGDNYRFMLAAFRLLGERQLDSPNRTGLEVIRDRLPGAPVTELMASAIEAEPGSVGPLAWRDACWLSMSGAARLAHARVLLAEGWPEPFLAHTSSADPSFREERNDAAEALRLDRDIEMQLRDGDADTDAIVHLVEARSRPGVARFRRGLTAQESARLDRMLAESITPGRVGDLVAAGRHRTALAIAEATAAGPSRVLDLAFRLRIAEHPVTGVRVRRRGGRTTVEWDWPQDAATVVARVLADGVEIGRVARADTETGAYELSGLAATSIAVQGGGVPPGRTEPIFDAQFHTEEAA